VECLIKQQQEVVVARESMPLNVTELGLDEVVIESCVWQAVFEGGTSLGDVYQGLVEGGLDQAVAEFLADQTNEPGKWAFPGISHADGYEAYQVRHRARP